MGWGGIIASAAAGGLAGFGKGTAEDAVERQKQEAQALRDQRLAEIAQNTHKANLAATAQSEIDNAVPKAKAAQAASDATLTSRLAEKQQFENQALDTAAAASKRNAQTVADAEQIKALAKAQNQGAIDKIVEENRTDEQKREAKAKIDEAVAKVDYTKAQTGKANAEAQYARAHAGVVGAAGKTEKADPTPKWTVDKETGVATDEFGFTKETVPGVPFEPAKKPFFGSAKPAQEAQSPKVLYSKDGTYITEKEYFEARSRILGKLGGAAGRAAGEAGSTSKVGSPDVNTAGNLSPTPSYAPSAAPLPPGYKETGRTTQSGKRIVLDTAGRERVI